MGNGSEQTLKDCVKIGFAAVVQEVCAGVRSQ